MRGVAATIYPLLRTRVARFKTLSFVHGASIVRGSMLMVFLCVAGCAQTPPVETFGGTQMVEANKAFAFTPPGSFAITGVLERRYANATQQDIMLATSAKTPGQNMVRVRMFGPV